jgi:hypothetical protein
MPNYSATLLLTVTTIAVLAGHHPSIAAQGLSPQLTRLYRGDFVWSLDFPRENTLFLGYVSAFAQKVRAACQEYQPSTEEEFFLVIWSGTGKGWGAFAGGSNSDMAVLSQVTAAAAASAVVAESELQALLKAGGCTGARLKRLMDNASRMLEGRRAAHGGPTRTTLIEESVVTPSTKHNYFSRSRTAIGWMTSTELVVFDSQLAQEAKRGMRILECTYESETTAKNRDVQYYWSGPIAYLSETVAAYRAVYIDVLERDLRRASHQGNVRHPFRDYGPPRAECPARLDPRLPKREIAPVVIALRPTISESAVTVVRDPVIKRESSDTLGYDYGPAPESFVPPIPTVDTMGISITMEKQGAGALVRVRVGAANTHLQLSYLTPGWQDWLQKRPTDAKLVLADFNSATLDSARDSAAYRPGRSLVLECRYLDEREDLQEVVFFWFKTRPAVAEPTRLQGRVADHPMLRVKAPRGNCPATFGEASELP